MLGVLRVQCQRNNQLHAFQSLRNTNMGQSHGLHSNDSNAGLVGGERQQERRITTIMQRLAMISGEKC